MPKLLKSFTFQTQRHSNAINKRSAIHLNSRVRRTTHRRQTSKDQPIDEHVLSLKCFCTSTDCRRCCCAHVRQWALFIFYQWWRQDLVKDSTKRVFRATALCLWRRTDSEDFRFLRRRRNGCSAECCGQCSRVHRLMVNPEAAATWSSVGPRSAISAWTEITWQQQMLLMTSEQFIAKM